MRRKFILILENQLDFNKEIVQEEKINRSSRLVWNPLSPQLRLDMYYYVHINRLDLKDEFTNLGHAYKTHDLFVIKRGPVRPYDYNDDV